ncbi:MAG: 2-keto-4-pentenoate hydratase [Dehalococcoidia bacterium]
MAEHRGRNSPSNSSRSELASGRALVAVLADLLWDAEAERQPVAPLTDGRPDLGLDDAYAVQLHNVGRRVGSGAVLRGRKVGLTSRVSQELLGVHEPTFGALLDDMFVDDGEAIALDTLVAPRVEAEIAFVMGADLAGPGVTTPGALAAIGGVLPAIEVVDSRIADWRVRLPDTVADNASAARVVLGGCITPPAGLDLRLLGVLFIRNGTPIDSGAGAAVLGNPARCVAWLANTLGALGAGLRRGDIVLPGALHRMVPVRPGDVFEARFAHIGNVTAQFTGGETAP